MIWRCAPPMLILGLLAACGPSTPAIDPFDNSGEVPTAAAATATPSVTGSTSTPSPTAAPVVGCTPGISADRGDFELVYDSSFRPYVRFVVGYTLACGEILGSRLVVELAGPTADESFHFFLSEDQVDLEAAHVTVDVPVNQDPGGKHVYSISLFDSLGYESEAATGEYTPSRLGEDPTPTEGTATEGTPAESTATGG